jgi:HTH-type transcriptional regulator/antitoxin HipB
MLIRSPKELALLVVHQRKKLKLSQAEVGNLVGLKQKTISALENKPGSIQLDTLFRVLSALNLDIKLLVKNEADETSAPWKGEW